MHMGQALRSGSAALRWSTVMRCSHPIAEVVVVGELGDVVAQHLADGAFPLVDQVFLRAPFGIGDAIASRTDPPFVQVNVRPTKAA